MEREYQYGGNPGPPHLIFCWGVFGEEPGALREKIEPPQHFSSKNTTRRQAGEHLNRGFEI
jgi:hypothetical protein